MICYRFIIDDIPIQRDDEKGGSGGASGNPTGALNSSAVLLDSSNQLQSINEEGESQDGVSLPTAANLSRNTPGRQSKEFTAKLHKVSFPNFKKLKDKADSKSKLSLNSSSGSVQMTEMSGSGSKTDSPSSTSSMAPMKQRASILKDKLINRNQSVPSQSSTTSSDAMDGGGGSADKVVALKMKNISLDSGTGSSGGGGSVGVLGGSVLGMGSSGANSTNSFDLTESSSDPLENNHNNNNNSIATRPSILPLDLDNNKGHSSSNSNGGQQGSNGAGHTHCNNNSNVQVYQL